jgi:alpha-beta hydrolase superfamily lysophospholipase
MPQLAEALAPNFTVVTYDRRGKGASTDTLPYAVDREIEDLQALIDLAGGPTFVHGFSSGGILALLAAERGTVIQKLSLLEPPLRVEGTPARGVRHQRRGRQTHRHGPAGTCCVIRCASTAASTRSPNPRSAPSRCGAAGRYRDHRANDRRH